MTKSKPIADLSLDLDNKWSYMKTHGDEGWQDYPSYLPKVIPLILEILARHDLKITVMIVGRDALIPANQEALRLIPTAGHEIGNHSLNHEPWLQFYSQQEINDELSQTEAALAEITDQQIVGFRGPGYSLSRDILNWLAERDYLYDASTCPTFLGPLARTYFLLKSRHLSREQRKDRKELFGSWADGFRSLRPYQWETSGEPMLELPVSTMPVLRTPFHFSYLHFLLGFSRPLAVAYFRWCLMLCRLTGMSPSLLMHPLDFLGGDEVPELEFFPGMNIAGEKKREFMSQMLDILAGKFQVMPMRERATAILEGSKSLKLKQYPDTTAS